MTPIEFADFINSFPTNEEVAAYLKAEGITGTPKNSNMCPIAAAYKKNTNCEYVSADYKETVGLDEEADSFVVQNSEAVEKFIYAFDAGRFRELMN